MSSQQAESTKRPTVYFRILALASAAALATAALAQETKPAPDAQPASTPAQPAATPAPATTPAPLTNPNQPPPIAQPDVRREPPPLNADPGTINLGYMEPEQTGKGKSKLTNTGDKPLKILRTQTSCACTVLTDLTNKVLAPGESLDFEASLKGGKYPGMQQKYATIFVEGYAPPIKVFVIGEVAYGVKSTPTYVDCFQTRKGQISFESTDGKTFKIVSVNGQTPPFEGFDPAKDEARTKYTLKYDFEGIEDPTLPRWWLVETDHPRAPVVDLRVINPALIPQQDPKAPWQLMEDRGMLGSLAVGDSKEIGIGLRPINPPAEDAPMPEVSVESDQVKVEASKPEPTPEGWGMKMKVTAVKGGDASTLLNTRVTIKWLGAEHKYDLFGRVTGAGQAAMRDGPKMQ